MALYAVLEEKGLFDWSTKAMGHPKRGGAILASTGSLGHGLPMAVGLAMAKKIKGEAGRVFCLIGDGECNEGTTWESAMIAAHHKLDNLFVIVDWNGSSERALSVGSLRAKFLAFDWFANVMNGDEQFGIGDGIVKPLALIARTTKGIGVPFMQDPSWHNRKMSESEYNEAIKL